MISTTNPISPLPADNRAPRDPKLYQLCREFEEVMTSNLLKQGLSKASESFGDEKESGGDRAFSEMAYEQLAGHIGRLGLLGLADTLYNQLTGPVPTKSEENPT